MRQIRASLGTERNASIFMTERRSGRAKHRGTLRHVNPEVAMIFAVEAVAVWPTKARRSWRSPSAKTRVPRKSPSYLGSPSLAHVWPPPAATAGTTRAGASLQGIAIHTITLIWGRGSLFLPPRRTPGGVWYHSVGCFHRCSMKRCAQRRQTCPNPIGTGHGTWTARRGW